MNAASLRLLSPGPPGRRTFKEHNIRQRVVDLFAQRPGYALLETAYNERRSDYDHMFDTSVFCLAPPGKTLGWGRRATLAARS